MAAKEVKITVIPSDAKIISMEIMRPMELLLLLLKRKTVLLLLNAKKKGM